MVFLKPIKGHERYVINHEGLVFDTHCGMRQVNQYTDNQGYKLCTLEVNGDRKLFRIHRLMGVTYLDNPDNLPQVNHKDGNKMNNHISNLEWCSNRENTICGYNNNAYIFKRGTFAVDVYSALTNNYIGCYRSMRKLCAELGLNRKTLRRILLGERANIYHYRFVVFGKGQQTTLKEVASA